MNTITLARSGLAATLAFAVFCTMTAFASPTQASLISTTDEAVVTFTPDGGSPQTVRTKTDITGPGEIAFGAFGIARLSPGTRMRLATLSIDEKTRSVSAANLQLIQGRAWMANFLVGSKLAVSDNLTTATTSGGAFVFEHATKDELTTATIAASRGITILTATATAAPTYLTTDMTAQLTQQADESIETITSRARGDIASFVRDQEARDAFHLTELISDLDAMMGSRSSTLLSTARAATAFLPAAHARVHTDQAASLLHDLFIGQTQQLTLPAEDLNMQKLVGPFVPFARLAATTHPSDALRTRLFQLSKIDATLARAAVVQPLAPGLVAYHHLLLSDGAKTEAAKPLLARVSAAATDVANGELVFRQLANNIDGAVRDGHTELARLGIQTLAEALQTSDTLPPQLIAELSEMGTIARQQLTYLASLPQGSSFDERDYATYLAHTSTHAAAEVVVENRVAEEAATTSTIETPAVPASDPVTAPKRARPPRLKMKQATETQTTAASPDAIETTATLPAGNALQSSVLGTMRRPSHRPAN